MQDSTFPTIGIATSPEALRAVYRFRYGVYVEEMARKQNYANPAQKIITDPLDESGVNFVGRLEGQIVGVLRANLSRRGPIGSYESFYEMNRLGDDHPNKTSIATRLMVAPEFRRGTLAMRLILAMYDYGIRRGVRWNVMDCNDHLVPMFSGLGYVTHKAPDVHEEYGLVNVMSLDMLDQERLRMLKSPYWPRLKEFFVHTTLTYEST